MTEHFRFEVVKAGDWRRYREPMGTHGKVDEDRPHFIAQTEAAEEFVRLNAELVIQTGLCPGWVKVGDREILAYRFREVTNDMETIERVLRDLDAEVSRVMGCCGQS